MRYRLHYAEENRLPDPRWRGKEGVVLCCGHGPGPRNVLVRTADGEMVVVPRGNVLAQRGPVNSCGDPESAGVQRIQCDTPGRQASQY